MEASLSSQRTGNSLNCQPISRRGSAQSNCSSYLDPSIAHLRRLKTQENVLSTELKQSKNENHNLTQCEHKPDTTTCKQKKNLHSAFIEMRNLFQEIKLDTEKEDLEELQKNITLLESKMKTAKIELERDINKLKQEEDELLNKVVDDARNITSNVKICGSKTLSIEDIVPSPVKTIISTPLKCKAIQEYQDFIYKTKKHGGWNEYHHNIFISVWKKYFPNNEASVDFESRRFLAFFDDITDKIKGLSLEDMKQHVEWYKTFLILKNCKQKALDAWRKRKEIKKASTKRNATLRRPLPSSKKKEGSEEDLWSRSSSYDATCSFSEISADFENQEKNSSQSSPEPSLKEPLMSRLMRPTQQWLSRCNHTEHGCSEVAHVDNLRKLRIPNWRADL